MVCSWFLIPLCLICLLLGRIICLTMISLVQLYPDSAPYSVQYILELLTLRHCAGCQFYRAEGRGESWDLKGNHIKDVSYISFDEFWVLWMSSCHLTLRDILRISGIFWPSICPDSRNTWSSRHAFPDDPYWSMSNCQKRCSCMGWLWSWVLHKFGQSCRMEKFLYSFWLCPSRGYGNCWENRSAPNEAWCME